MLAEDSRTTRFIFIYPISRHATIIRGGRFTNGSFLSVWILMTPNTHTVRLIWLWHSPTTRQSASELCCRFFYFLAFDRPTAAL